MKIRILATPTSYIAHHQPQVWHPNDKACPEHTDWEVKLLNFAKFEEEIQMDSVEETINFLESCQVQVRIDHNAFVNYGLDNAEFDVDDFGTPLPLKGTAYAYQLLNYSMLELEKIYDSIKLKKSDIKGVHTYSWPCFAVHHH